MNGNSLSMRLSRAVSGMSLEAAICIVAAAVAIAFALMNSYYLLLLTFAAIYIVAAMGLNVLTGYAGIISIAHGALVCVGAYATAIATVHYGWNFWPAALLATVCGMAFGALLGLPTLRLSSWYYVLITIAFTLAVTAMLADLREFTGGYGGIVGIPSPSIGSLQFGAKGTFWLVVAVVAVLWWVLSNIMNSRIGWALHAIREGGIGARANGVSPANMRLFAFAFSGACAGLAGAFYACAKLVVTPEDFSFDYSIFFLFVVVLGGPARLSGPLLGVLAFYVVPELLGSLREYRMIVYGVGLLAFAVFMPAGLAGAINAIQERWRKPSRAEPVGAVSAQQHSIEPIAGAALAVDEVVKDFGGVRALDGASIRVEPGSIHAIVGPNGSGKTTLLNVISGFYRAESGQVMFDERPLVGLNPTRIARLGVQRTFQTPKLLGDLSVHDNIRFGGYSREEASGLEIALSLPRARAEGRELDGEAAQLLALVGLAGREGELAAQLPHGQQRLVEIARALIARPRLLLLDEPAAGLSLGELERLGDLMKEMRRLGITIVMVEHHIELVSGIADHVTVLDQGRVLASGVAETVFRSAVVVEAYMGVRG